MATIQFVGTPTSDTPADCDAAVVALKIRSIESADAVAQSLDALGASAQRARSSSRRYRSRYRQHARPAAAALAPALLAGSDPGRCSKIVAFDPTATASAFQ
jgi:3-dehydrotetronate 4-kinase